MQKSGNASSVAPEVRRIWMNNPCRILPDDLSYKSRQVPSSAIVYCLHRPSSERRKSPDVVWIAFRSRIHTAEVGGSSPLAPTPAGHDRRAGRRPGGRKAERAGPGGTGEERATGH